MAHKKQNEDMTERCIRTVFVGNVPYDAIEAELKEILSEVGTVLSVRLVSSGASGKSKGYGFCEYRDQETALSAMRNLHGYVYRGRTLRVVNACTEKLRMEMQHLMKDPELDKRYGEHCEPEQAPAIISQVVASLPPQQLYEAIKEMQQCIQNNPSEARQMLMTNPQLAYAVLQGTVAMGIVDPGTARGMLFKANEMPPVLGRTTEVAVPGGTKSVIPRSVTTAAPSVPLTSASALPNKDAARKETNAAAGSASTGYKSHGYGVAANMKKIVRRMPEPVPPPMMDPQSQGAMQQLQEPVTDQQKAALIMQVLKVTDEQIAQMPQEQRAGFLLLKEQIAKSTQR